MPSVTAAVSTLQRVQRTLKHLNSTKQRKYSPHKEVIYTNIKTLEALVSVIKNCDYFKIFTGGFPVLLVRTILHRMCLVGNKMYEFRYSRVITSTVSLLRIKQAYLLQNKYTFNRTVMYELYKRFSCFKRTVADVTTCSKLDYHFFVSSPYWFLATDTQHRTYGETWSLYSRHGFTNNAISQFVFS